MVFSIAKISLTVPTLRQFPNKDFFSLPYYLLRQNKTFKQTLEDSKAITLLILFPTQPIRGVSIGFQGYSTLPSSQVLKEDFYFFLRRPDESIQVWFASMKRIQELCRSVSINCMQYGDGSKQDCVTSDLPRTR